MARQWWPSLEAMRAVIEDAGPWPRPPLSPAAPYSARCGQVRRPRSRLSATGRTGPAEAVSASVTSKEWGANGNDVRRKWQALARST